MNFIEVHSEGQRRLININWVEEVWECENGKALIFFAFIGVNCVEQDNIRTDETYDEVRRQIWR